ncbi:2-hydroxy-3-oxopropionate reductase [Ectothiorhodospiraceae bacterium 2226]|nr:2-hydroxy-3-oxopropionate reductase [Ectothiorhodospiraceae bacterium 2226]
MANVGFVGLGIMGRPMALNLLRGGHRLWVHARQPEVMKPLVESGATRCKTCAAVAEHADVLFVCVSDTPDVEQVTVGATGFIQRARPGSVVVDMSTISPKVTREVARRLAERGVDMLDAPVSGGERGAIAGTLSIMVGGKPDVLERVRPLLNLLGKNIVHVGDHGAGQVAKACNQIVVGQTIAAVAEGLLLARAAGADPARVREALLGGMAASRALEVHGERMLVRNFAPGFKARLHQKDLRIALEAAREAGVELPGASLTAQHVDALVEGGAGDLDSAALAEVLERLAVQTLPAAAGGGSR